MPFEDFGCCSRDLAIIERDFGAKDEAIASIAILDIALAKKTLSKISATTHFGIYGNPLYSAATLGSHKMIDAVTATLSDDNTKSRAEKRALVLGDSIFAIEEALKDAIDSGSLRCFRRLLDFLLVHVTRKSDAMYTELMSSAINRGDNSKYLKAIFAIIAKDRARRKYHVPIALLNLALQQQAKNCIIALIKDGRMDIKHTETEYAPIFMAIRSNSVTSVATVLAAGADIDLPVYHPQKKQTMTPLTYATDFMQAPADRKVHIVNYLLSQGAALPALLSWLTCRIMYNKFRDAMYEREGVYAPEYKVFKKIVSADPGLEEQ
ncbi:hypothetical protein IQ06DRAFT_348901 [Phaeosphaeriaceae sp. SRC1lsM3a]|nr:hypothetical protein IQ06DRAFT_348901 [Stagonospora sp. SRC1lsM3a]